MGSDSQNGRTRLALGADAGSVFKGVECRCVVIDVFQKDFHVGCGAETTLGEREDPLEVLPREATLLAALVATRPKEQVFSRGL